MFSPLCIHSVARTIGVVPKPSFLCFSFLQYISAELCLSEGDDNLSAPSKEQLEQEKQLLLSFKPVMQKFLHDHTDLQVSALYALQVHCNTYAFPKGKLLLFALIQFLCITFVSL